MAMTRKTKDADPLPFVGMWNDIPWARSDALHEQIKGHAREMGIR